MVSTKYIALPQTLQYFVPSLPAHVSRQHGDSHSVCRDLASGDCNDRHDGHDDHHRDHHDGRDGRRRCDDRDDDRHGGARYTPLEEWFRPHDDRGYDHGHWNGHAIDDRCHDDCDYRHRCDDHDDRHRGGGDHGNYRRVRHGHVNDHAPHGMVNDDDLHLPKPKRTNQEKSADVREQDGIRVKE